MTKKIKVLSSTLCALLLSSGIATANVYASPAKVDSSVCTLAKASSSCDYAILDEGDVHNVCTCLKYHPSESRFERFLVDNDILHSYEASVFGPYLYDEGAEEIEDIANGGPLKLKRCGTTISMSEY